MLPYTLDIEMEDNVTQGMVTIQRDGMVIMKIVAGCEGGNAQELAMRIGAAWPLSIDDAYAMALAVPFGSRDDLVVITADSERFDGDEDLDPRYRKTFDQPRFNPRWTQGTVDHVAIVNVDLPVMT